MGNERYGGKAKDSWVMNQTHKPEEGERKSIFTLQIHKWIVQGSNWLFAICIMESDSKN